MNLEKAKELAMKTDYAVFAVEEENEINQADAGAFFLEGFNYAMSEYQVKELKQFFIWFQKNGEKHIGISVEDLIQKYISEYFD